MTTKELIKALKKQDPFGNLEVTVGKTPIYFVERMPAYYDGCLQKLVQDKTKPYYNITGGVITSKGYHVNIHTMNLEDAIYDDPNLPITLDMEGNNRISMYEEDVSKWREEAKLCIESADILSKEYKSKRKE